MKSPLDSDEIEKWLPVPGWEDLYEVSDAGHVRSLDRIIYKRVVRLGPLVRVRRHGRLLSLCRDSHGYLMVNLCRDAKLKASLVHHLVLAAFVAIRPAGSECRHLDGNRANNRLENLVWGTNQENLEDKRRHGTIRSPQGEEHALSKLSETDVIEIRNLRASGSSPSSLSERFGISTAHVRRIAHRRAWQWLQ